MTTLSFSVMCQVCLKEVDSFTQSIRFILTSREAVQEMESIELSCGCIVNFPDWQIDVTTGVCKIYDFTKTLYLIFLDEELILEEDD